MLPRDDNSEIIANFFNKIWRDTEGRVYLATKNNEQVWRKYLFEWPQNKDGITEWVLEQSASGHDVYCGPAIYKPGADSPTKENILGSWTYWSEWDGFAPDWSAEGPQTASSGFPGGVPSPSIRVRSSVEGHEHAYWLTDQFQDNVEVLERVNRTITYAGNADRACWNSNRVLRPPGTVNTGNGKNRKERPVYILDETSTKVVSKDFDSLPPPRSVVEEELSLGKLPTLERVLAKYEWTEELLELFKADSPKQGDRSSAMVRISMMCAEQGFSEEAIYVVLLDVDDRWGKYKERKDRERLLVKMVERAKTKHPQGISEEVWIDKVETNKRAVYGFRDLLDADVHIDWLIKDLLPRKGLGVIAAAPGVGKTLMGIDMGINLALGRPYLNWDIEEETKVMFLSLEMSEAPFQYFQTSIAPALSDAELDRLNTRFLIAPVGEMLMLDSKGDEYVNHLLAAHKPDVVIIDSLSQMLLDMQNDVEARKFMSRIRKFADVHDTAFIFVHHNRKPSENKPSTQADMFGSVFIASNVDFIISLWIDNDQSNMIRFAQAKNRLADRGVPMLAVRDENLRYSLVDEYNEEEVKNANAPGEIGGLL